jgi:hypothetical protein
MLTKDGQITMSVVKLFRKELRFTVVGSRLPALFNPAGKRHPEVKNRS